jgi:hypothetical protein
MRRIYKYAAGATVTLGVLAVPASAMASSHASGSTTASKVVIATKSFGHNDTTSVSGTATLPSGNGPVWAEDNLAESWTITPISDPGDGANYSVTLKVNPTGSHFAAWADPRTAGEGSSNPGGPLISHGTITGTLQYDVQSSTPPDLNSVPAIQAPGTGLGAVLHQVFDNNDNEVGGGHYTFTYKNVAGSPYTQTG